MKVNFSHSIEYVPVFNGNKELPKEEQLVAVMKPMTLLDLLDLTDVFKAADFTKGELEEITSDQMRVIIKSGAKYIKEYCAELRNAEGFTLEDVIAGYPAFGPLSTELLFMLVNQSSPNEADVKN